MLFNSLDFVFFLPIVIILYYLIPQRFRWVMLLGASYYFYMCWRWEYIFLIILSTLVDYWAGIKMHEQPTKKGKRKYLFASLGVNLGLLFFFKYLNFFTENTGLFLREINIFYEFKYYDILLPVGISFYTFQTLSYTIDIYQGKAEPERHLGYFALYVSYFPQLVAGPIERSTRLLPQIKQHQTVTTEDVKYAVNKILLGFFKKLVIADSLALYVNLAYNNYEGSTGTQLYMASFFFGAQLFADFSGYTDIAMGSARLMGVRLMENFNRPYWVSNMSEYWSRWHISLTSWIRDYLFVPIVKRSSSKLYAAFSSIFVLVIIGFWHGAEWTYVMFGFTNGIVLVVQTGIKDLPFFARLREFFFYEKVVLPLLNLNWLILMVVYFRSVDMKQANLIHKKIFTEPHFGIQEFFSLYKFEFYTAAFVMFLLLATVAFNRELKFKYNWLYVCTMISIIIFFGQDLSNQFVYFQF